MIIRSLASIEGPTVTLGLAVGYLVVKIIIKVACRMIARTRANWLEVAAWFGVDASVLTLTFSAGARIPWRSGFTDDGTLVWYGILIVCMVMSIGFYVFHLVWRRRRCVRWKRALLLAFSVTGSWLCGLIPLMGVTTVLTEVNGHEGCDMGSEDAAIDQWRAAPVDIDNNVWHRVHMDLVERATKGISNASGHGHLVDETNGLLDQSKTYS